MRDYGIVRVRFWAWAKDKGLSSAARELALYCMTAPHSNALGCYRLPIAYISEDLGTVPDTVRQTVSELAEVGFLRHDEKSGWVWIVGHLGHNPIANPNVGKSLVPFIASIPRNLPFFQDFVASLAQYAHRFPNGFIDGLGNGIGNGSGNGMPNQNQIQEQEQEQDHSRPLGGRGDKAKPTILALMPADPPTDQIAFDAWNETAKRVGRWPLVRKLDGDRRKMVKARINDAGGIGPFLAVLAKAEGSRFVREDMNAFALDWFLKAANFRKVAEGNYDDGMKARSPPATVSKAAEVADVMQIFREREQRNGQ